MLNLSHGTSLCHTYVTSSAKNITYAEIYNTWNLANAKVSARLQCVWRPPAKNSTTNQRNEHNDEKYIQ